MNHTCEKCGHEIEEGDFYVEVWTKDRNYDFICEECAKEFCDAAHRSPEHNISVESPENHNEECHKCWFCEEVTVESEMVLEGEDGNEDWLCKDCLNSLISRGEPIHLHCRY